MSAESGRERTAHGMSTQESPAPEGATPERSAPDGMVVRPFDGSDRDFQASVDIWNALWPDEPASVEGSKYSESIRDPKYLLERLMVELEGNVVCHASYREPFWSYAPGKYDIQIRVLPDYQRRGIGGAVYELIMERLNALPNRPVVLHSDAREDQPHSVKFLTDRGFEQKQRQQVSRLDLASFDSAPFAGRVKRLEESDLVVMTLEEFEARDPEAIEKVHAAFVEFFKDVPFFDDWTEPPLEQFRKDMEGPWRLPGGFLLALDGGEIVATTSLWKRLGEPGSLNTGLTAVARSHRRRGIAAALKVRAIEFAKGLGARVIQTDNEEKNPMYDLNVQLGFRPVPAWLLFKKQLGEAGEDGRAVGGEKS
jgi:mycothiol synthase